MTTLVFDVNETLLDISDLDPFFESVFGTAAVRKEWFSQVIQDALVASLTSRYADFGQVGVSAFELVANRKGIKVSDVEFSELAVGMRSLPPHPDVPGQLDRLKAYGFRMATLTNSSPQMVTAQLGNSGLAKYFDRTLSVDVVKAFKPALKTYRYAESELQIPASALCLIAAHNWDTTGAKAAGWQTAFVARDGMRLSRLDSQPDIIGTSMIEIADQLIARSGRSAL